MKKMGIYKITNPVGEIYIGQTVDYERRLKTYRKNRCITQPKLYDSFLKYDIELHIFEFIESCCEDMLNIRERHWQDLYDVVSSGLNLKLTKTTDRSGRYSESSIEKMKGSRECMSGSNNPFYGKTHTDESKKLISEMGKGRIVSNETRLKISNTMSGMKNTKTHNKNISNGLIGHIVTDETRKKKSESMKKYHQNNKHPMEGRLQSEETRKKISSSQKLRILKNKNNDE